MIVFAHAGHWISSLLYLAPLVALVVAVGVGKVRDRRSAAAAGEPPVTEPGTPPTGAR